MKDDLRIVFAGAVATEDPGELLCFYPGVGPDKAQLTRARFEGAHQAAIAVIFCGSRTT